MSKDGLLAKEDLKAFVLAVMNGNICAEEKVRLDNLATKLVDAANGFVPSYTCYL